MKHSKTWSIKDRHPETPLSTIELVSARAESLWSRNLKNIVIEDGFVSIIGALDTLEALDYHYSNFIKLKTLGDGNQKHELAAYLNRLGQLFYFATSAFTKSHVPESPELMLEVKRLILFRHKNSAHRSIDKPKKESDSIKNMQAISLLGLTSIHITSGDRTLYQLPAQTETGETEWIHFIPESDHLKIMRESYELMELLVKAFGGSSELM